MRGELRALINSPLLVFVFSLIALRGSVWIGAWLRSQRKLEQHDPEYFGVVLGATLTLLGLIIGFSFSMAVSRYDQRKNYEEEEANAIGTEYLRADLLPATDCANVTSLLRKYLDQRMLFYRARDEHQLERINAYTAQLQNALWSAVRGPAAEHPTPVSALVVAGMNDVLNSQGYTQAAWWNRIPIEAWGLMVAIGICGSVLLGYAAHSTRWRHSFSLVLPFLLSISFLLIADIESPRHGLIRVHPQNLLSLSRSLHGH